MTQALVQLRPVEGLIVETAAAGMGELAARSAGLTYRIAYTPGRGETTAMDTRRLAAWLSDSGVDLIMFAGGDGTARDVLEAIGSTTAVLGIPAGVKMQSGVFATGPAVGGALATAFLAGAAQTINAEVVDLDEALYAQGVVASRLAGYLRVPQRRGDLQGSKVRPESDPTSVAGIGEEVVRRMRPGVVYVIGPGTTAKAVMDALELPGTLLGVDVVLDGGLLQKDTSARSLEAAIDKREHAIVVSPIGGQGYVFGRGNQQISPAVLERTAKNSISIVATLAKLATLQGRPLRVDTGDAALDHRFAGFARVVTGVGRDVVYPIGT